MEFACGKWEFESGGRGIPGNDAGAMVSSGYNESGNGKYVFQYV